MPGPGHQCSASNWLDTRFSSRLVTSLRSMTSRRAPAIYNRGPKGLPEEITTLRSTARSLDSRAYLHGLIMVGRKVGIGILPCRKMSTCSLDIFGPCHPGTSSAITVFPVQIQRWSTMFSWHKVSVMNQCPSLDLSGSMTPTRLSSCTSRIPDKFGMVCRMSQWGPLSFPRFQIWLRPPVFSQSSWPDTKVFNSVGFFLVLFQVDLFNITVLLGGSDEFET